MFGILLNIKNWILNGIQSLKILQVNQRSTHLIHHLKGKKFNIKTNFVPNINPDLFYKTIGFVLKS
jgi:hypothetical protein